MKKQIVPVVWVALVAAAWAPARADVADLVMSSGVQGGLVVHLDCADAKDTARLLVNKRYVVHGLATDAAKVEAARKVLRGRKLYGRVSVAAYDGAHLPYAENLVNLVINTTGVTKVPEKEILRVLAPGGVAMLGEKKIVKPRPKDIDDWTHYLHGADNNAVADDRQADIPRSIQWVSDPRWGRSHEELASMSAAVTTGERIFYIVDEAPLASIRFLGRWKLVGRDAFNGTLLWKRSIPGWTDHLRHFRSGPVHLPRRLVAGGGEVYVTLGLTSPVTALDAATGETLRVYKGTERAEEILLDGGLLFLAVGTSEAKRRGGGLFGRGEPEPVGFRFITAVEAKTGKALWRKDFSTDEYLLPLTLAAKGGRVYYQSSRGVSCLDARTGQQRWQTPRTTPRRRMSFSAPTLVATDEVVLCADRDAGKTEQDSPAAGTIEWGVHGWNESGFPRKGKCTLKAYAVKDGKELWSVGCSEGYNSPVDLFVVGDIVWVGPGFKGLDLKTGEVKKQVNTKGPRVGMPHHRCYRDKATCRMILTGRSGVEIVSFEKGWLSNNSWIRGTCQYGIIPANGLIYAPPDACACFLTVKSPGFFAAAPQRRKTGHMPFPAKPVLEKGPLYAKAPAPAAGAAEDWPMYRRDAARSAAAPTPPPTTLRQRWSAALLKPGEGGVDTSRGTGRLTQPVVAKGKVFVASVESHTLHALNADNGRAAWQFTAGGRIDSSPTVWRDRVLFGCADGWIYCLGADDGRLAWRFRAAPADRRVMAYGQLESTWPVHGAVLVQNDTLYATAGRSSYLDGGLVLYRLNPGNGQQLSRTVLYHLDPNTGRQLVPEARFNMEGSVSDILSGDGQNVYLKYFVFDAEGKRTKGGKCHLFSIAGLLGEEWFVRSYWIIGEGMPGAGWGGWANAAKQFPFGRILCFNDQAIYGYGRQQVAGGPVGHRMDAYHLFAMDRKVLPAPKPQPKPAPAPKAGAKKRRKPRRQMAPKKGKMIWSDTASLTVRAMAAGGQRLVLAGPVDLGKKKPGLLAFENEPDALAGFQGQRGIFLRIVSATDGKKVCELPLKSLPVFDGLSLAGGRIYLSLKNGTVACFGK